MPSSSTFRAKGNLNNGETLGQNVVSISGNTVTVGFPNLASPAVGGSVLDGAATVFNGDCAPANSAGLTNGSSAGGSGGSPVAPPVPPVRPVPPVPPVPPVLLVQPAPPVLPAPPVQPAPPVRLARAA